MLCSVCAERSCYQGGEVAQADEGEEEQDEEDPWCEEGKFIIIRLLSSNISACYMGFPFELSGVPMKSSRCKQNVCLEF
jgi:hypothetical protein